MPPAALPEIPEDLRTSKFSLFLPVRHFIHQSPAIYLKMILDALK
jgi:hypothetical protein